MNNRKKVITIGSLLITLILVLSAWVMFRNYHIPQKAIIENLVTETLGAKATIGELHISPEHGTARIGHLRIFNPGKGFSDGAAVEIENIDITIAGTSPGVMLFSEITASGIQANLEVLATKHNLSAITSKMKNVKPEANPDDTAKIKIAVAAVFASHLRVRPRSLLLEGRDRPIIKLPDLTLPPVVGLGEHGVPVKIAIAQVWQQIVAHLEAGARNAGYLAGMTASTGYAPVAAPDPAPEYAPAEDDAHDSGHMISE